MGLVIPQHYGQVIHSLRWEDDAELMAVTIGVSSDDAANDDDVITLAGRFTNAFVDNMLPDMAAVITLVQTEVRFQLEAPPEPLIIGLSTSGENGSGVGTVIPQNSAFLIHKRTSHGGRGGRGRWYLPGIGEGEVDDIGQVTGAHVTALNAALAGYLADVDNVLDEPHSRPVLLHNEEGAFAGEIPYVISTMTCDPLMATQRRRLRR